MTDLFNPILILTYFIHQSCDSMLVDTLPTSKLTFAHHFSSYWSKNKQTHKQILFAAVTASIPQVSFVSTVFTVVLSGVKTPFFAFHMFLPACDSIQQRGVPTVTFVLLEYELCLANLCEKVVVLIK